MKEDFSYINQYKDHFEGQAFRKGPVNLFSEGASPARGQIAYTDKNQNIGAIDLEIVEENNYYPFGLKHKGYNSSINGRHHKYMFGGKELQDEIVGSSSFEVYDFGARNYDPALGRWKNLDPLAEQMRRHSPYNYAFNNPIYFIDPDGVAPTSPEHIYRLNEKGKIELVAIDNTKDVVFSADGKRSIEFDSGTIMAGFSLENPNPDYAQDLGSPIEGVYMNDENSATELFEFAAAETGDPIKGAEWAISTGDLKGESLSMVGTNYNNTKVDTGLLTESLVENGFNVTKADHSHQDDSPPSGFDNNKALLINGERIKDAAAAGAIEKTTKGEAITRVFNVKSKTYTYYTKNLIYGTN
ncbi:RHS repeat-associated core domain-containing protein [Namhaeicola litoreus]|uniref:RHS repeat-associated core domain-containing protein n=1 Tax=Namhaeicola litoreus TaxID=1052145 RepID=A0ABW3Y2U3_9FLAO